MLCWVLLLLSGPSIVQAVRTSEHGAEWEEGPDRLLQVRSQDATMHVASIAVGRSAPFKASTLALVSHTDPGEWDRTSCRVLGMGRGHAHRGDWRGEDVRSW